MRRFSATLAGAVVVLASLAGQAGAATRWSPATVVAGESPSLDLGVLGDSTAIAILTFHRAGMTPDHETYDHSHVEAAVRPPGGVFSLPKRLTGVDRASGGLQTNFGDDALLWIMSGRDPDGHPQDALISRPDGSEFQPAEPMPENAVFGGYLDERGDLTTTGGPQTGHPWLGIRTADGTWTQREINTKQAGRTYGGETIAEPDGTVTLIGRGGPDGSDIVSITAPPGGAFGPPETVARNQHSAVGGGLKIVHDSRGDALMAWIGGPKEGTFEYGTLHTAYRPAGGHWRSPKDVPGDPFTSVDHLELAMNASGDAVLVWTFLQQTAVSYRPAGESWERATPAPGNPGSGAYYPVVAIGANGDATAVYPATDQRGVALDHPAGLGWQPPEAFTEGDDRVLDQHVGVAADGTATAIWRWWADPDHHGIRAATHRIAPAPPAGDAPPTVSDYQLSKSTTFGYRVSEKGGVEFALRRAGGKSRRVVATFTAKVGKGKNATKLPDRVRRRLNAKQRYRATIVAVDRAGQYSKQRTLIFSPGG